jgi:hypothetical protein
MIKVYRFHRLRHTIQKNLPACPWIDLHRDRFPAPPGANFDLAVIGRPATIVSIYLCGRSARYADIAIPGHNDRCFQWTDVRPQNPIFIFGLNKSSRAAFRRSGAF